MLLFLRRRQMIMTQLINEAHTHLVSGTINTVKDPCVVYDHMELSRPLSPQCTQDLHDNRLTKEPQHL